MAETRLAGLRILVVEDEYILAEDLAVELRSLGSIVVGPAPTVTKGFALLETEPQPDGAILDINLGGTMAFPLADALSARRVPFVFATGYEADMVPSRYDGIARIEKPFDVSVVTRALERALSV